MRDLSALYALYSLMSPPKMKLLQLIKRMLTKKVGINYDGPLCYLPILLTPSPVILADTTQLLLYYFGNLIITDNPDGLCNSNFRLPPQDLMISLAILKPKPEPLTVLLRVVSSRKNGCIILLKFSF